jgi:hypothetical protein
VPTPLSAGRTRAAHLRVGTYTLRTMKKARIAPGFPRCRRWISPAARNPRNTPASHPPRA